MTYHPDAFAPRKRWLALTAGPKRLTWEPLAFRTNYELEMVGVAGFEPATPASRTQCSTGLSHTPTKTAAYSLRFCPLQEPGVRISHRCKQP